MKFKHYKQLIEATAPAEVPNLDDSLGVKRHRMPQLTNFDAFKADLADNKIRMSDTTVVPSELTPTQDNFNQEKVDRLKKAGWDAKPIIISKDNYVIDGHHRWLAAHQLDELINARQVDLNAEDFLEFCKGKDYIEKKTINESMAG